MTVELVNRSGALVPETQMHTLLNFGIDYMELNGAVNVMTVRGDFEPASGWVEFDGILLIPGVVRVVEGGDVGGGLDFGVVVRQQERVTGLGLPCLHNVVQVVLKLLPCR